MQEEFLKGWKEIGRLFGANAKQAKGWREMGAPILFFGREPVTRSTDLWYWLLENREQVDEKDQ